MAHKGAACVPAVEDVLVNIFHYFKKNTKRQSECASLQQLFDLEHRRMLKHICTRWLSIGRCLEHLLHNSVTKGVLQGGEKSTGEACSSNQEERQCDQLSFLKSPTNKLYVLFLEYTVKSDEPKIHVSLQSLLTVFRNLLMHFVKLAAIQERSPECVQFKTAYNLKNDSDLVIGEAARACVVDTHNNSLRDETVQQFFADVKKNFTAVCLYIIENLPLAEPCLCHAEVADVREQLTTRLSDLAFFLTKCPAVLPGVSINSVTEQFSRYQATDITTSAAPGVGDSERSCHPSQQLAL